MDQVPYTHPADAKTTKSIAGKLFHPGDTRPIPRSLHPDPKISRARKGGAPEAPTAENDMETLRADTVKDITAKLPQLDAEQLDELEKRESGDKKPRPTLLKAIDEERLRRNVDPLRELQESDEDKVLDQLADLSDEDLARLGELEGEAEQPREAVTAAINAETKRRADEGKADGKEQGSSGE